MSWVLLEANPRVTVFGVRLGLITRNPSQKCVCDGVVTELQWAVYTTGPLVDSDEGPDKSADSY